MNVLHLSPLPVWGQGRQAGMPSLYECLRHYALAGHRQSLVLPRTLMVPFGELHIGDPLPDAGDLDLPVDVSIAPTPALAAAVAVRSRWSRKVPGAAGTLLENAGATAACIALTRGLYRQAMRLAASQRFDVVYAHNDYAALAGWLVARRLGIPNVTRLYGTFLARLLDKPLLAARYPVMVSAFRIPSDLLIVTRDGTGGQRVANRFGVSLRRLRHWPNGVDEALLAGNADGGNGEALDFDWTGPAVATLHRHEPWKGLDRLIRAWPKVHQRLPDAKAILCGGGSRTDELRELAASLGVADAVLMPGPLDRPGVRALLGRVRAVVSVNDLSNRGNPVIEAVAAGCPVVSLDDGSTTDLLTHEVNALLVAPGDEAALADALVCMLSDERLEARLRDGARGAAAGLQTWAQRLAMEIDEVECLVESRRRPQASQDSPPKSSPAAPIRTALCEAARAGDGVSRVLNAGLARLERRLRRTRLASMPTHYAIETTNICDGGCVLCPVGEGRVSRPHGRMSWDCFRRLVDEISPYARFVGLYNWGEPFLHGRIYEMVRHVAGRGIYTKLSTNLHSFDAADAGRLVSSGLSELAVSLHGASEESYRVYQPAHGLDETVEKVRAIVAARAQLARGPAIHLGFIVTRHNRDELDAMHRLAAELGVDCFLMQASLNLRFIALDRRMNPRGASEDELRGERLHRIAAWLPDDDEHVMPPYRYMRRREGRTPPLQPLQCLSPWYQVVICWDGEVNLCCGSFDRRDSVGNAFETPMREIWNNAKYRAARAAIAGRAGARQRVLCDRCCGVQY